MSSLLKNKSLTSCILLLVVTVLSIKKITDFDIWYHLVIGREISTTLGIPATEFYIYPLMGQATSYHEWGFGLLYYEAVKHLGFDGMNLLNALIGGGTLLLLYLAAELRGGWKQINLGMLFVGVLLTSFRMIYRPEMILFLCLAAEILCLEGYSVARERRWLVPVPLLAFFLSQCHPSVIFLLFVFCCYSVQIILEDFRSGRVNILPLFLTFLLSVAVSAINPYGINQLLLPFNFASQKEMLQQNFEFFPLMKTGLKYPFFSLAAFMLTSLSVRGNRKLSYWLLFLTFGYLTFKYQRNFALFVITGYVPLVAGLGLLMDKVYPARRALVGKVLWGGALAVVLSVSLKTTAGASWGFGADNSLFPVKAADFILKNTPPGRIFNYYNLGGYLGWRLGKRYPASIDGRHYEFDKSFRLHDKVFWDCDNWENTLRDWDVDTIIIPATSKIDPQPTNLLYVLDASRDWVLVSEEPSALTFVRKEAFDRMASVKALDKNLIWRDVVQDALNAMRCYNEHDKSYLALAIASFNLHNFPDSLQGFRAYKNLHPQNVEYDRMLALLEGSQSGDRAAREELEEILRTSRNL